MAGYFNMRIAPTTSSATANASATGHPPAHPHPHPNSRLRAASSSGSRHFSTSVSEDRQWDKGGNVSNGTVNGAATGAHPLHPLRHTWVFWFRQQRAPSKVVDYESGIKKVSSFGSIESFWSLFTHLQPPSALQPTTDYLLFHSGVRRPVWEDPLNLSGGKWIIRLRKGVADRLWEDLVCAVVGDQFAEDGESGDAAADVEHDTPPGPEICGCTISVRNSEDILSVWNRGTDAKVNARIRDTIKRVLNLPQNIIMEYKTNSDSMGDRSSFRNSAIDTGRTTIEREKS